MTYRVLANIDEYNVDRLAYEADIPDPVIDTRLKDCPTCGAKYCLDNGRRRGPTVIMFKELDYKVVCLNCWRRGRLGRTVDKAIEYWNSGLLSSRLRSLRRTAGISQDTLADLSGVKRSVINRLEAGIRITDKAVINELADYFGVEAKLIQ